MRKSAIALGVYGCLVLLTGWSFGNIPTGFVPTQDKQYLVAFAQLPDGASLDRTEAVIRRMSDIGLNLCRFTISNHEGHDAIYSYVVTLSSSHGVKTIARESIKVGDNKKTTDGRQCCAAATSHQIRCHCDSSGPARDHPFSQGSHDELAADGDPRCRQSSAHSLCQRRDIPLQQRRQRTPALGERNVWRAMDMTCTSTR